MTSSGWKPTACILCECNCGIEVRLELPESMPRLTPANELTLFRVAQEALTNVQRHSASPWVALRLEVLGSAVALEVDLDSCSSMKKWG